jgi:hypothetical protein
MTTVLEPPPLATGWETGTPVADSLVRRWLHHWADQVEAFALAAGGAAHRDERYAFADYRRPSGLFNAATLLAPPPNWYRLLDEIDGRFRGGSGEVYLWSLWPTPDLRARGWTLEGHPPLLVRPPTALAPVAAPDRTPSPVRNRRQLAEWERVTVLGYPLDELAGAPRHALADPALLADDRLRLWLGRDERGRPVSASAQFVSQGLASLAFGVTLPQARRRGQWSVHARHRLRAEPELWHAGVFSDFSRPGAERLGFVPIIRFTLYRRAR